MVYPKIGIILVNYNGYQKYMNGLFFSLAQVEYPGEWEIVLVDNASIDKSLNYVKERFLPKFLNLKIIELSKNIGFAGGSNKGIEYLLERGFDFAYLLNVDTVVTPDFLKKIIKYAKNDIGSVQSKLLLFDKEEQANSIGNIIHFLGYGYAYGYGWSKEKTDKYIKEWRARDSELRIAYSSGAATLINLEAIKKVGMFDEDYFMYHEDLDLGWRLSLAGYKNILAPDSVVYHKYEFGRSIKKYYWMERNRFIAILANYSIASLILIFPAFLVMELGSFIFAIFSGWAVEKFRAYSYFFYKKTWQKIRHNRKQAQSLRKVSDKELSQYFVGEILFQDMMSPILTKIANRLFNLYWWLIRLFF